MFAAVATLTQSVMEEAFAGSSIQRYGSETATPKTVSENATVRAGGAVLVSGTTGVREQALAAAIANELPTARISRCMLIGLLLRLPDSISAASRTVQATLAIALLFY
jgi:hypothetical protein